MSVTWALSFLITMVMTDPKLNVTTGSHVNYVVKPLILSTHRNLYSVCFPLILPPWQIFENTPHYYSWQVACQVHVFFETWFLRGNRSPSGRILALPAASCVLQLPAQRQTSAFMGLIFCLRFPELQNWSRLFCSNSWFTPHLCYACSPSNKLGNLQCIKIKSPTRTFSQTEGNRGKWRRIETNRMYFTLLATLMLNTIEKDIKSFYNRNAKSV